MKYIVRIKDNKVKDSIASEIVTEIKKAYPDVQLHTETKQYPNGGHTTKIFIVNYDEMRKNSNFMNFRNYLYSKYSKKYNNLNSDRMTFVSGYGDFYEIAENIPKKEK